MPLHVTSEQHRVLIAHARAAVPEECCGFLIGRRQADRAVVTAVEAATNVWDGDRCSRFLIEPRTQLHVQRETRAAGLEIVGFYHSHPHSPPSPSRFDREMAWPEYSYLIISLAAEPPELASWRCSGEQAEFEREELTVNGS